MQILMPAPLLVLCKPQFPCLTGRRLALQAGLVPSAFHDAKMVMGLDATLSTTLLSPSWRDYVQSALQFRTVCVLTVYTRKLGRPLTALKSATLSCQEHRRKHGT